MCALLNSFKIHKPLKTNFLPRVPNFDQSWPVVLNCCFAEHGCSVKFVINEIIIYYYFTNLKINLFIYNLTTPFSRNYSYTTVVLFGLTNSCQLNHYSCGKVYCTFWVQINFYAAKSSLNVQQTAIYLTTLHFIQSGSIFRGKSGQG